MLLHGNSDYTNAPQCYVVRTLPILFHLASPLGGPYDPERSEEFSFDGEVGEVKNAWSIASISVLCLQGLVLKHQDTNYRRQYHYATNAPKLLAVIRAKTHLAPCCTVPSTPIEFVELDLWLYRIVAIRVWNNIWLKFIHEETLTKSALSGIQLRIISFLITPGIESLWTEYKLLCFHRE